MKLRLLDLFCKAGGAGMGYSRAGFEVVGVDIEPQKNYPFEFHQADAFEFLKKHGRAFDVIHASPPCQAFTSARVIHGREHKDLLTPMREALKENGRPWIIENVPGAPMRKDLMLCGSMFDLKSANGHLVRHRLFEFSDPSLIPLWMNLRCSHQKPTISVFGHGGHVYHGVSDWREVMGIPWMSRDELAQAIPPAYTEFIGTALLAALREAA